MNFVALIRTYVCTYYLTLPGAIDCCKAMKNIKTFVDELPVTLDDNIGFHIYSSTISLLRSNVLTKS